MTACHGCNQKKGRGTSVMSQRSIELPQSGGGSRNFRNNATSPGTKTQ
ncbi:MAG: hypothetical protein IPP47_06960 [Bryobacterales bacterium]|nr:hypothetical protein [Bryobacterales bacterium]